MIASWSEGVADDNMAESILTELAGIVLRHPWWRARSRLTLSLLDRLGVRPPSRVLDAGCGWGATLEALERQGYRAAGMDISWRALERLDGERAGRLLFQADLTRPLPEGVGGYDAVLALDVIEHLDDDHAAVARLGLLARPGGIVIVSVPALPELFTEFDAVQGHRRRYLPETLRAAFDGSGLSVERVFWWGSWLVPTLRRQRARVRSVAGEPPEETYRRYLTLPPAPLRWALRIPFDWEQRRALDGALVTGTSLFAVARRHESRSLASI